MFNSRSCQFVYSYNDLYRKYRIRKEGKFVFVTGIVKVIDYENGTITTVTKKRNGGTHEDTIKVSKQTKYFFVKGIKGLESGDGVNAECRGLKGEYEAVKVKRITKAKK